MPDIGTGWMLMYLGPGGSRFMMEEMTATSVEEAKVEAKEFLFGDPDEWKVVWDQQDKVFACSTEGSGFELDLEQSPQEAYLVRKDWDVPLQAWRKEQWRIRRRKCLDRVEEEERKTYERLKAKFEPPIVWVKGGAPTSSGEESTDGD